MSGGKYGVRAVGLSYTSTAHQLGIAVLGNIIHDQSKDPIFTDKSDWSAVEGNELYQNASSDLQINADPISTCQDEGISYTANICDGAANAGQGQGGSEFFLVTENYGHHGDSGPNFTSVRNSSVSNNILARMSAITPPLGKKPAMLILGRPAIPLRTTNGFNNWNPHLRAP